MESNPLSDKIIQSKRSSFKLWLEFEVSTPWDDVENDFANIGVDTLDGRGYGINVWTFKYLDTARKEELEEENRNYLIPPDLFVKELTRDCIEETIIDLLNEGNIEDLLNESTFGLSFHEPYFDAMEMEKTMIQSLLNELKIELSENHPLHNESFDLIARKTKNDDIVLELEDGRIAVVHLTWKSKKEVNGLPLSRVYKDKIEFWHREMMQDILEFK